MALKNIIDLLVAELGLVVTNDEERAVVIARINEAAKEIYHSDDLKNSTTEEVFDIDQDCHQVALPEYVGEIRGARWYDTREKVALDNLGVRYSGDKFSDVWYLNLREKRQSPTYREITNQSTLSFSIPVAEAVPIDITVQGPTDNSSRASETVTIPAGQLSVTGLKNFKSPVQSIRKNVITASNVTIKDVEDNILAVIPNSQFFSIYHIYQVVNSDLSSIPTRRFGIEVWFKYRFVPLKSDEDTFIGGDSFDWAIVQKYLEHRARNNDAAIFFRTQSHSSVNNVQDDSRPGKRRRLAFIARPWFKKWLYGFSTKVD